MKQKYFKTENIFFLSGHGAENLRNPQRYKLHTNQYAAIALNPGEQGLIKSDLYKVIDDKDFELNIEIPKGGKKMVDNLGFGDYIMTQDYDKN